MHILFFVSIALLVLYLIPCQSKPNSDLMDKIIPALDLLCPYSNVCREYRPGFVPEEPEDNDIPCCEECSCAEDCHIKSNCCFPEERNIYSECIETVIPPLSPKMYEHIAGYKIITQPPSTGCINESSPKLPINQAPWGDLYPVSSPSTKQIYKNQSIAECHNVFDGILWKVNMSCSNLFEIKRISHVLDTFDPSINSRSPCNLQFLYPGDSKDIASERCLPRVISSCQFSSFLIPDNLNLTHNDYIALCNSDFKSARIEIDLYKNPFCLVCNEMFKENKHECSKTVGKTTSPAFSFILNSKFVKNTSKVMTQTKDIYDEVACRKVDIGSDKCRIIHCPYFHIRDENGDCIPMAESVGLTIFEITLSLIPEALFSTQFCVMSEGNSSVVVNMTSESPWDFPWIVTGLFCNRNNSLTSVNTLYLILEATTDANVTELLAKVSKTLQKRWQILLNGSYIQMRQQNRGFYFDHSISALVEVTSFIVEKSGRVITEPLHVLHNNKTENEEAYPVLHLTPLFFCKQVELKPDEYNIDERGILTYYMANITLFRHEYIKINSNTNYPTLRICLEDSGFIKPLSNTNNLYCEKKTICVLLKITLTCVLMKFV